MRHKTKINFLAFSLALVLAGSLTAYADTKTPAVTKLTPEKAIETAISNSGALKTMYENESTYAKNTIDLRNQLSSSPQPGKTTEMNIQIMQNDNRREANLLNIEITKQKLEISTLKGIAGVISAQNALQLYDVSKENELKELTITKVKSSMNLVSESAYLTGINNYSRKEAERISKEKAIESAYITLNNAIGAKINTRYELELNLKYSKPEKFSINDAVREAKQKSANIKTLEGNVDVAKYRLERFSPDVLASFEDNNSEKESLEVALSSAERDLDDALSSIEQKITNAYNDLLKLEASYESNLDEYETMKKNLEITKTKYELGKITELDYSKYKYQISQMQETLRSQVIDLEIQSMQLKYPCTLIS